MGYLGVKTMVSHIKGEKVERRIDTGVRVVGKRGHGPARGEGAAQAGSRSMAEEAVAFGAPDLGPRFEMRGIRKTFGATLAVDGVDLVGRARRGVRARRPERRRQEHADGDSSPARSNRMPAACLSTARRYRPGNPLDARRAGVAMIYQELSLAPHLSVAENILLGMEPARLGLVLRRDEMRRTASDVLTRLGHPEISDRRAGRHALPRRSAARRDWPRARRRLPGARPRRTNEQPVAERRETPVRR